MNRLLIVNPHAALSFGGPTFVRHVVGSAVERMVSGSVGKFSKILKIGRPPTDFSLIADGLQEAANGRLEVDVKSAAFPTSGGSYKDLSLALHKSAVQATIKILHWELRRC